MFVFIRKFLFLAAVLFLNYCDYYVVIGFSGIHVDEKGVNQVETSHILPTHDSHFDYYVLYLFFH